VPDLSYLRRMVRGDGDPNRFFLTYLFTDRAVAIEFLQDVGLLRSQMPCNTCGRDMKWASDSSVREGFRWRCQKRVTGTKCNRSASIKHGSWFQRSNLTLLEILVITYDIVNREQALKIQLEYSLSAHTVADWGMFYRETMLVFVEGCSVKIGGPNKTVEIDESKFGRRKHHRALLRVNGCLAVLNESPGKHSLFP
jgi:hypothetical protein